MITPQQIGLPDKFTQWRDGQEQIITNMLHSNRRFHISVVPTGGGKSLSYMAVAKLTKGRTLVLTSTKGLQDQLLREFGNMVAVVKGKSAYKCKSSGEVYWCHTGTCRWGYDCPNKWNDCHYYEAVMKAKEAKIVVTNYSFWMANQPEAIGNFDLLVMDEAHDAAEHLLSNLSMEIYREEVYGLIDWIDQSSKQSTCYEWAKILKGRVDDRVKKGKGSDRGKVKLLNLQTKLTLLGKIWTNNWVVEHKGKSISFDAIWPSSFADGYLFRGIPKVIMTSAFVTKMDLTMLGLKDEETEYIEYPSTFPVENRKVYFVPTVRMDRYIKNEGMNAWAARIDQIIRSRLGEKGIVHTISFERAKKICNFSSFKDFMIEHEAGKDTAGMVEKFKTADPPSILVSPSMVTGYDFPDDQAHWQIIGKVPFPDSRPLVMKARQRVNQHYGCYIALKQLVQASGRIVRSPEDWGETFIIDDHIKWVIGKYKELLPKWWVESFKISYTVPTT